MQDLQFNLSFNVTCSSGIELNTVYFCQPIFTTISSKLKDTRVLLNINCLGSFDVITLVIYLLPYAVLFVQNNREFRSSP